MFFLRALFAVFIYLTSQSCIADTISTSFDFPIANYANSIKQKFGDVNSNYGNKQHAGDDIAAIAGTSVFASASGKVMFARKWKNCPNWGHVIVVEHLLADGTRVSSIYGHLSPVSITVSEGEAISKGQKLGLVGHWVAKDGTTCWGDHLHFGIYVGAFGAAVGTYPQWLAGYIYPAKFPASYCDPITFLANASCTSKIQSPLVTRDIWTTSVYSYAAGGGGPGGGLHDDRLIVGGWGDEYRSLIQFDLNGQPKAATSVILRLFNISTNAGSNGPTPMYLYRITSSWDWTIQPITTLSPDNQRLWWVNQPTAVQVGAYGNRSAILPAPTVGATYDIDITDIYNFWQSNPTLNFGIELRPQYTSNYWNVFASSQNATAARRPQLIITP